MTKPTTLSPLDDVWVRIHPEQLYENAKAVQAFLAPKGGRGPALMAVVKANGYGHGIGNAALAFRSANVGWFGVTSMAEALELVDAGIEPRKTFVLVFTPAVTKEQCSMALRLGLHMTICDLGHWEMLSKAARDMGISANVHLKVDTGMSRLGLPPHDAAVVAKKIFADKHMSLVGVYTHFARAFETDLSSTQNQLRTFLEFCDLLTSSGITGFLRHCANSAATLRLPESRLGLVRVGTLLYGQYPSADLPRVTGVSADTMSLEARVVFVHDLPAGATIGYGAEYTTKRKTRAAVLPVGFADGFTMQPSSLTMGLRGFKSVIVNLLKPTPLTVSFGTFKAPVLGRVAMQQVVVDVTDAPGVINAGDIAAVGARRLAIRSSIRRVVITTEAAH